MIVERVPWTLPEDDVLKYLAERGFSAEQIGDVLILAGFPIRSGSAVYERAKRRNIKLAGKTHG